MDVNAPPTIHLTNPIGMSTQRTRGDCIAHRFMELQEQYPNHRIGFYYHNFFFSSVPNVMFVVGAFLHKILIIY